MNSTTQSASPLRQRMLDDMRMRKLEPTTQQAYVRAVRKLAAHPALRLQGVLGAGKAALTHMLILPSPCLPRIAVCPVNSASP